MCCNKVVVVVLRLVKRNGLRHAVPNSQEQNACPLRYLSIDNHLKKHSALSGRSPQQRLHELIC